MMTLRRLIHDALCGRRHAQGHDAHQMATVAINALEDAVARVSGEWTTDDLGTFWQGATEACVLRLVRLKPEMVRHVDEADIPTP